jgi:hypothetical protein
LDAPPDIVFPFLTPEGEKKWAAGWDFDWIYPPDRSIEEDAVFTTSAHDHHQVEAIWIVNKYDPGHYQIEYYRVEPGVKVGHIQLRCEEHEPSTTLASITYTYTGLNDQGKRFVKRLTEDHYREFITSWEQAINHYLATGQMLLRH